MDTPFPSKAPAIICNLCVTFSLALKQDKVFYRLGQLASMCLVHGGGGFHVLSQAVFKYISGVDSGVIIAPPDDVGDSIAKSIIDEVKSHDMCSAQLFTINYFPPLDNVNKYHR